MPFSALATLVQAACHQRARLFADHATQFLGNPFIPIVCLQVISAGADGLVKLWSVRTGECVSTFDEHAGKIWGMTHAGTHESLLATGESGLPQVGAAPSLLNRARLNDSWGLLPPSSSQALCGAPAHVIYGVQPPFQLPKTCNPARQITKCAGAGDASVVVWADSTAADAAAAAEAEEVLAGKEQDLANALAVRLAWACMGWAGDEVEEVLAREMQGMLCYCAYKG